MSDQTDNTQELLKQFGLSDDGSKIYLFLLKKGVKSALEISRELKMGRTKIYRIVENLNKMGLVKEKFDDLGKKFEASTYKQLEMILKEKETELEKLRETKEKVFEKLKTFQKPTSDKKSKVLYYHGVDGLKQITWNSLIAKGELNIFEISEGMHPFTGKKFAEKMREEYFLRKIFTKQLTNIKKFEPFTNVEQYVECCWKVRFIDPKALSMDFELLIYNDVVAIYDYKKQDDVWGIEIYNRDLAHMQKQIFAFLWSSAKKMKIGKDGGAEVT